MPGHHPAPRKENNRPPPPSDAAPPGSAARRMLRANLAPIRQMRNQNTRDKSNYCLCWGNFIYLVATFFCLIYSVKFDLLMAMAWINASMLGTLQGWLLLEPFEIVVGATKGE